MKRVGVLQKEKAGLMGENAGTSLSASRKGRHTSRKACSFSFCSSSYSYIGFMTVPGAGLKNSLVVLLIRIDRDEGEEERQRRRDCRIVVKEKKGRCPAAHTYCRVGFYGHWIVVLRDWFDKQSLTGLNRVIRVGHTSVNSRSESVRDPLHQYASHVHL